MDTETISIVVYPLSIVVFPGVAGKLWYQAPGLDIYVSGKVTAVRLASVHYTAVAETVARHIPALSLRNVRAQSASRPQKIDPNQKDMFK